SADGLGQLFADDGVFQAVMDHETEKFVQIPILFQQIPVQPGDLIILAVAVVVAVLRVPEFVAGRKHGGAPAAHEDGAGIADHAATQVQNLRIIGRSFLAAVPAAVVVGSVGIVPAVVFVVLFIISVEIVKGKPVVAGDEIYTGIVSGISAGFIGLLLSIKILGTGDALQRGCGLPVVPF